MLIGAPTELKLNIPQLSLAKLAESVRHESVHTRSKSPRVSCSIPTGLYIFLLKLFCNSLCKQYKNDNIANFTYYGKTRVWHFSFL